MKEFEEELSGVIESAVTSTVDLSSVNSLRELFDEKKDRLKLSDNQIHKMLGMTKKTLESIINVEAKSINFINIIKISHFLGLSIHDIVKLCIPQMDVEQIREIAIARESGYITEHFDVATLIKLKFLERGASSEDMSQRIQIFFGLDSIYSYTDKKHGTAFSRPRITLDDLMEHFWVKMALRQFELIDNPYKYDNVEMVKLIPKISRHTLNERDGLITVIRALYAVGVTVIYQPNINKIKVKGATMAVSGKPCIVLSDPSRGYAHLWTALMHELFHVMYDFDDIKDRGYHLSLNEGEDLSLIDEMRANDFAYGYFLDEEKFLLIVDDIEDVDFINTVAHDFGVHPSLIYLGHYSFTQDKELFEANFARFTESIRQFNFHQLKFDTLAEVAEKIKKVIG